MLHFPFLQVLDSKEACLTRHYDDTLISSLLLKAFMSANAAESDI